MNSESLQIWGLGLSVTAIIISLVALFLSRKMSAWSKLFRKDNQPENLEEIVDAVAVKIKNLELGLTSTENELARQAELLSMAIQHVGLVRFDSGADDGGNLSFTVALLDAHQTGIVITSLHGRQHNRVYSKPIVQGQSETMLSDEEKSAVIQAVTSHKKIN